MCDKNTCLIVPPHILEALAKQGSNSCKKTLNDTRRILQRRKTALNNLLVRGFIPGEGDRLVYDSEQQYEQRLKLVRKEGGPEASDPVANATYNASGFVRDFFRTEFQLNSLDGQGMEVVSNIHYGLRYNNAYWDGDEMTYGDGDGKDFSNFATAIDVVAHELVHGITQFRANLEYQSQSGALNEHFSDVFATVIKQRFLNQTVEEADWLIGDTVVTENFPGVAIRSLKAPGSANEFDVQPDHMDRLYTGNADNQGVHINSGIPNKAFYLSSLELGMADCSLIWFRTLTSLWRTADFLDMLEIILRETQILIREGRVAAHSLEVINQSFASVGLHYPQA